MANGMYSTPIMGTSMALGGMIPMPLSPTAPLNTTGTTTPQMSTPMPNPMGTTIPQMSTPMPIVPQVSTPMPTNNGFGLSVIDRYSTSQPLSAFYDVLKTAVNVNNIIPSQEFYAPNTNTTVSNQNGARQLRTTNGDMQNPLIVNDQRISNNNLAVIDTTVSGLNEQPLLANDLFANVMQNTDLVTNVMQNTVRNVLTTGEPATLVNNFYAATQTQRMVSEPIRVNQPTNTFSGISPSSISNVSNFAAYSLPTNRFYSSRY